MSEIKLLKVIRNETRTSEKTGKEYHLTNRYIVIGTAKILVNPVFEDGYTLFDAFAEVDNQVRKDAK